MSGFQTPKFCPKSGQNFVRFGQPDIRFSALYCIQILKKITRRKRWLGSIFRGPWISGVDKTGSSTALFNASTSLKPPLTLKNEKTLSYSVKRQNPNRFRRENNVWNPNTKKFSARPNPKCSDFGIPLYVQWVSEIRTSGFRHFWNMSGCQTCLDFERSVHSLYNFRLSDNQPNVR